MSAYFLGKIKKKYLKCCLPKILPNMLSFKKLDKYSFWLCWGLMTCQPLWVILCRLPEKGRKEIEETVEMKERDREETGTGMRVKKKKK